MMLVAITPQFCRLSRGYIRCEVHARYMRGTCEVLPWCLCLLFCALVSGAVSFPKGVEDGIKFPQNWNVWVEN